MNLFFLHYVTDNTVFACVYFVGPVCHCLDFISSDFPKFLLCHSLYSYFQKEEEIDWSWSLLDVCPASVTKQVMQEEARISHGHQQQEDDSKSNKSKEALELVKEVSSTLKHNIGTFGRKLGIRKKVDNKSLMSSIPAQLVYILLNSPQPLQIKIKEILSRVQNRMKTKLKISNNNKEYITKYEPLESPDDSDNEEEAEDCYYIPIMLNHTTASSIPNITGSRPIERGQQ